MSELIDKAAFKLTNEEKQYRLKVKKWSNEELILALLIDIMGGVSRTRVKKCLRYNEAVTRTMGEI